MNHTLFELFKFIKQINLNGLKTINLKLQEGLKNVFDEAIIAAMEPPAPPTKNFGCQLI